MKKLNVEAFRGASLVLPPPVEDKRGIKVLLGDELTLKPEMEPVGTGIPPAGTVRPTPTLGPQTLFAKKN